ncbi:hypothetical protein [Litchfieldella rifensis]|uniref:DUF1772 domain-containing protein n=1 Tax=Litchfieldella rifensis TaxID=762643 RepID=A0ABV7LKX6_9GAMM
MWWLVTLLIAALGLVMGGAHVLELPVRMQYEPEFYMQVTSTLYLYFGLAGGPIQVIAFVAAAMLTWLLRHHVAFRSTLAGSVCLGLSLVLWFLLVQPVNAAWADALQTGSADAVQAYAQLRSRWEYGHVAAFVAWCLGFTLLLNGLLREAFAASSKD